MQKKALIIDDEAPLRDIIRAVLSRLDIECIMAESGKTAITLAQSQNQLDLIVIDMNMPEMSGQDTYTEISKLHPESAVIFISGYDMSDIIEKMNLQCENCFIKKPFSIGDLSKVVSKMLN